MEAQQGGSIKVAQVAPKAPMAELPQDLAKKPLGYFRDKMRVFIIVRIRCPEHTRGPIACAKR